MPRTHIMFFTLEDADAGIADPSFTRETDVEAFEFIPMDNPMDAIETEEQYLEWQATTHHARAFLPN